MRPRMDLNRLRQHISQQGSKTFRSTRQGPPNPLKSILHVLHILRLLLLTQCFPIFLLSLLLLFYCLDYRTTQYS
jgi:hypothetical protein